jgi:hypothetical protein
MFKKKVSKIFRKRFELIGDKWMLITGGDESGFKYDDSQLGRPRRSVAEGRRVLFRPAVTVYP